MFTEAVYAIFYLQYLLNAVRPLTWICTMYWAVNSILPLTVTGGTKTEYLCTNENSMHISIITCHYIGLNSSVVLNT